jgi:RimJ/RimL family protein N-acetyltransferase
MNCDTGAIVELVTPQLILRPFRTSDITNEYISWLNDKELMKYSEQRHRLHTYESCLKYYEAISSSHGFFWAIVARRDRVHIGNITVHIDLHNNLADVGLLIGAKPYGGRGLGFEAWNRVLSYLLQEIGVRKVVGGAMAENIPMISIMKKSEMALDCIRKRHYILDGAEVDLIYMAAYKSISCE